MSVLELEQLLQREVRARRNTRIYRACFVAIILLGFVAARGIVSL